MPRQNKFPLDIEKQYLRAIDRYLNAIDNFVLNVVRREINLKKFNSREVKQDGIKELFNSFRRFRVDFETSDIVKNMEKSTKNITKSLRNFSNRLNKIAVKKFFLRRVPKEAFKELQISGISDQALEGIVQQKVELIKTIGSEYFDTIQVKIEDAIREGSNQTELAKILEDETKVERNRAKFWASDQLGKAYGEINEKNQRAAGFTKFIWRTQLDQRVRDTHIVLEGKEFLYDELPVVDGRQIKPGEDYNCRCWAEPILEI